MKLNTKVCSQKPNDQEIEDAYMHAVADDITECPTDTETNAPETDVEDLHSFHKQDLKEEEVKLQAQMKHIEELEKEKGVSVD